MEERYIRNLPAITQENMDTIRRKHVLVVGCGGLGGYAVEYLARLGIGTITVVDGDVFSPSNLNRQILCTERNIGEPKVFAAQKRVAEINSSVTVRPVFDFLTKENAGDLVREADVVIDALDNVAARLLLEDAAAAVGCTVIHGAIEGWNIQILCVRPGSGMLHSLYRSVGESQEKTSLPMTPAICAGLQVSAAVQFLCGEDPAPGQNLFLMSVRDFSADEIPFIP